jgi:DNA-binding protein HU-beta
VHQLSIHPSTSSPARSPRTRASREGRNPATGETIQIAASRAAKFSAAAGLKQQLNS